MTSIFELAKNHLDRFSGRVLSLSLVCAAGELRNRNIALSIHNFSIVELLIFAFVPGLCAINWRGRRKAHRRLMS